MKLSKSKKTAVSCPSCGGGTEWIMHSTPRNMLICLFHSASFFGWLFVIMIFGFTDIAFLIASFMVFVLVSYVIKLFYQTNLNCEACGELSELDKVSERFKIDKLLVK